MTDVRREQAIERDLQDARREIRGARLIIAALVARSPEPVTLTSAELAAAGDAVLYRTDENGDIRLASVPGIAGTLRTRRAAREEAAASRAGS